MTDQITQQWVEKDFKQLHPTYHPKTHANPLVVEQMLKRLERILAGRRVVRETHSPAATEVEVSDDAGPGELERLGYTSGRLSNPTAIHAQEHLNRGLRAVERGALEQARDEFHAAASIDPSFADALFNLALLTDKIDPAQSLDAWERYVDAAAHAGSGQPQDSLQHAYQRLEELRKG